MGGVLAQAWNHQHSKDNQRAPRMRTNTTNLHTTGKSTYRQIGEELAADIAHESLLRAQDSIKSQLASHPQHPFVSTALL